MSQHYSDPSRESNPHALPDVETFRLTREDVLNATADTWIAERLTELEYAPDAADQLVGWYYWHCFPGCLPDSDPIGPFASEDEALADARMNAYDCEHDYDDDSDSE